MLNLSKVLTGLLLTFFISTTYALSVNMHSTNANIEGLGFTVNGAKHGGPGSHYKASSMPKGSYTFGVRMHGKDIGCSTSSGKAVKLTSSATVVLSTNGRRCTAQISS